MVLLATLLAGFAVWHHRGQTRRCLEFYGSQAAQRIQAADRVELWRLGGAARAERPEAAGRIDVSRARGVVHMRRALVEDANFAWDQPPSAGSGPAFGLAFYDRATDAEPGTVIVVRLDGERGSLVVEGRDGRVALGTLAKGLRTWLADVAADWMDPATGR